MLPKSSKRRPFIDKTNIKVKKSSKLTTMPCCFLTNSAINVTGQKIQMTTQSKETDSKLYRRVSVQVERCKALENSLTNNDRSDQQLHNDSNAIKMHLRKRKIKDYKELLRDSSEFDKPNQQTDKVRVPVYLKKNKTKESTKRDDPFEFTDEHPKKKKKDDNTDSDSSTFDKTMQEVLKEIENKEKKAKLHRKKIAKKNVLNKNQKLAKTNNLEKATDNNLDVIETKTDNNLVTSTPIINVINKDLNTQSPSKQINIISNIVIQTPNNPASSLCSFDNDYGDINDFIHHEYTAPSTPWRGDDLHLRRNPHWLALKNTSLPFYNQEMILHPDLVEKSETSKSVLKENSYIQSHISDFITCEDDTHLKINNSSSLFDEHSFSPIKAKEKSKTKTPTRTNNRSMFDENSFSPIRNKDNKSNIMKSKRSILSSLDNICVDNVQNIQSNYSFSFMDDENKENTPRQFKNNKKSSTALPMRVSITDLKKVQKEVVAELLENIVINESLNQSLPIEETSEAYAAVGLFEDLEPPPVTERTYASKRRRRVRIESFEEEEEEEKPKKKKKDYKTKAEEEAFRKWAASFNAMCEEVEQHHLETEPV